MQPFGGVSHSYAELIRHLRKIGCDCTLGVKESDNIYLKNCDIVSKLKPLHHTHNLFYPKKKYLLGQRTLATTTLNMLGHKNYAWDINQEYCIKKLKRHNYDLFEPTFFASYFLDYLNGKPFTLEVHDMIPELFPQYFSANDFQIEQKKLLCPFAAHIHTPSQRTKEDLVNILKINPDKITVTPHGWSELPTPSDERPIDNPYILFVGTRGGYKNFNKTLQEFSILVQKEPDLHLICTGSEFTNDEMREIESFGLIDCIHQMYASEAELSTLYHHAEVFVFPSAYEGFGLPILEAWSCDCLTFLNNASCFPEVAGDAAVFFDIDRKGDMAEKIIHFLRSPEEDKQALLNKQCERLKLYSWKESANRLYNIYKSMI